MSNLFQFYFFYVKIILIKKMKIKKGEFSMADNLLINVLSVSASHLLFLVCYIIITVLIFIKFVKTPTGMIGGIGGILLCVSKVLNIISSFFIFNRPASYYYKVNIILSSLSSFIAFSGFVLIIIALILYKKS
jgi:hypothetical protein